MARPTKFGRCRLRFIACQFLGSFRGRQPTPPGNHRLENNVLPAIAGFVIVQVLDRGNCSRG